MNVNDKQTPTVLLRICVAFDEAERARSAEILIKHVASDLRCDTQSLQFNEFDPLGSRVRMRGGNHVYLMDEALIKVPAENQSYMQRLLSKGTLIIRLPQGGQGFLNLQNLIGYTAYPGAAEIPADSWIAQPKRAAKSTDGL